LKRCQKQSLYTIRTDEAYLIFSEFGDTLIEKIDDSLFLNKAIDLLLELLKENETTIENLIVLQVFQKLYLTKDADIKFTLALKDKSIILSFYMEYRLKYLGE